MNKKRLAKAVLMSLVCTSWISVCEANIHTITSSCEFVDCAIWTSADKNELSNEVAVEVTDSTGDNSDVVITFKDEDNLGALHLAAKNRSDFINSAENKDVYLTGAKLGLYDSTDNDTMLVNNGKSLTLNTMVDISSFNTYRSVKVAIYNDENSVLNVNNYLYCMTVNKSNSEIKPTIENKGKMNINSSFDISNFVYDDDITGGAVAGFVGLETTAILNYGELNIDFSKNSDCKVAQSANSSTLVDYEYGQVLGDIVAKNGSVTNITLGGLTGSSVLNGEDVPYSMSFWGAAVIEENADFNLHIKKNGLWYVSNRQNAIVDGLTLSDGNVILGFEHDYAWWGIDDKYVDDSKWCTLKLTNLKCDGNFTTGGFEVHTDLANDEGDKIEIISMHDNNSINIIPVYINDKITSDWYDVKTGEMKVNVDDLIAPNEGHSVTIATTPATSNININGFATYTQNGEVYDAVVNETFDGNTKYWNFVGWEKGEDARPKDKAKQEQIDHSILVEDVEPIFKRFNDLRTDPSEVGVWIRGETGETKIRNLSYDHNVMSGGYDWERKNDAGILFTGIGFTYSTNECDDKAIGDTKGYGVNVYGSWLGKKNNDYVDLVVKYGKLDKSYAGYDENNIFVSGDYDKDLFTVSAKYGRRIFKDDWYYEPSVGLAWGKVGSANFTDNYNTPIHADASYSTIASLGMQIGKNIKGIEYYGKAEVMHDFDGKIHVSAPGRSVEDDMGGTWLKCAIGASRKIDENNSFYLEVERDFGNKVEKPYGLSLGYRFTW